MGIWQILPFAASQSPALSCPAARGQSRAQVTRLTGASPAFMTLALGLPDQMLPEYDRATLGGGMMRK